MVNEIKPVKANKVIDLMFTRIYFLLSEESAAAEFA